MLNMCMHRRAHTWSDNLIGAELIHGLNQAEIWFLALILVEVGWLVATESVRLCI